MKILSIDPASNKIATSTTGIVFLDNTKLIDYWVVPYGVQNFNDWYANTGQYLNPDVVIVEQYIVRHGNSGRDNSVIETVKAIKQCYPDLIELRNVGYQTDIPDNLLRKLGLYKFDKSHHNDVRASARLALFWAMRSDNQEIINEIGDRLYA